MLQAFVVLDRLADQAEDLLLIRIRGDLSVVAPHLHDVVPGEVEIYEAPVLGEDF